jgi:hypothetical protein
MQAKLMPALTWLAQRNPQPAAAPEPVAPTVSSVPTVSVADELRKLAELRDAGVLTDDELAAQKARPHGFKAAACV